MNSILMKAILSMDSYNRGYNPALTLEENSDQIGKKIGNYEIIERKNDIAASDIGFYGIAYKYDDPDGEIVVAFRGTDQLFNGDGIGGDVVNGYLGGLGATGTPQANMAAGFYQAVLDAATGTGGVTLTGHSMGGGFAGLLGALYNTTAIMFDNMAFEDAATYTLQKIKGWTDNNTNEHHPADTILKDIYYGTNTPPSSISLGSHLQTYSMDGQFLNLNIAAQTTSNEKLSSGLNVDIGIDNSVPVDQPGYLDLHSMSTLVIRLYAGTNDTESDAFGRQWEYAAKYFWPVMYSDSFAHNIGVQNSFYEGWASEADKMRTMIAYSAISEGTTVFGDTAIAAFYHDAKILGAALSIEGHPNIINQYASLISQIYIQYATNLAADKIELAEHGSVIDGLLSSSGKILTIDFDTVYYSNPTTHVLLDVDIDYSKNALLEYFSSTVLKQAATPYFLSQAGNVLFMLSDEGETVNLSAPILSKSNFLISGEGNDIITGSAYDDIIMGGKGVDVINAGNGDDNLIANFKSGDVGVDGDTYNGGSGTDAVYYTSLNFGIKTIIDASGTTVRGWSGSSAIGSHIDTLISVEHLYAPDYNNEVSVSGGSTASASLYYVGGNKSDVVTLDVPVVKGIGIDGSGGLNSVNLTNLSSITAFAFSTVATTEGGLIIGFKYQPDPLVDVAYNYISLYNVDNLTIGGKSFRVGDVVSFLNENSYSWYYVPTSSTTSSYIGSTDIYNSVYNSNVTGSSYSGGTKVTKDTGGNIVGVQATPDAGNRWAGYEYADEVMHPYVITNANTGGGVTTMTLQTYLKELNFLAGITADDLRFTVGNSSYNDATLTVWIDKLNYSFDVTSFESGRLISGLGVYDGSVHSQTQSASSASVTSSSQGNFTGTYGGTVTYTNTAPTVIYNFEEINFTNHTSIDMTGTLTLTGTSANDYLNGMNTRDDILLGRGGSDTINAKGGNDILDGGTGNDNLYGGTGNDTYIFTTGYGQDVISEQLGEGTDIVKVTGGLTANDFRFYTDSYGSFYIESKADNTDKVTIFAGTTGTGTFETTVGQYVEKIAFDGGSFIDLTGGLRFEGTNTNDSLYGTQYNDSLYGYNGTDTIYGNRGDDVLDGGAGNDNLYGGAGDDTYIFTTGYGQDLISEQTGQGTDIVRITGGLTANDFRFYTDGYYGGFYIESKANSADRVNIFAGTTGTGTYETTIGQYVERVEFDNGSYIDLTGGLKFEGTNTNDSLYGTQYNDSLYGYNGTDTIYGNRGDDILDGGAGNDNLYGGAGDDTYIFTTGYGQDLISEQTGQGTDIVKITGGLTADDFRFYTDGYYGGFYIESKADNTDKVTIFAGTTGTGTYETTIGQYVEKIEFDDGSFIDLTGGLKFEGTNTNDSLYGTQYNDSLYGYNGTDTIYGNRGDDVLDGGAGNDNLYGGVGDDTYIFTTGYGQDLISEQTGQGTDIVKITGGLTADDFRLYTDGYYGGFYIESKADNTDKVTIFAGTTGTGTYETTIGQYVEKIEFDDGSFIDLTGGLKFEGSNTGDSLYGTQFNDVLHGYNGTDILYGNRGNDTLHGGEGNDSLYGGDGDDILHGDNGQDSLYGGNGADTFVFKADSAYNNIDIIGDFSLAQNDAIDIRDLLTAYDPLTDVLTDFVQITTSGSDSILSIDQDGAGTTYGWAQVATIQGVVGLTDEIALAASNHLLVA